MTPKAELSASLFDAQRRECLSCGGPLTHPTQGRPRRYCDADCAADGKRATERAHLTPQRLEAMRQTSRRIRALNRQKQAASAKATPDSTQEAR